MSGFSDGDRVELIHTNDEHTQLRPGDLGTVRSIDKDPYHNEQINIDWDSGSRLSMIPADGDTITPV